MIDKARPRSGVMLSLVVLLCLAACPGRETAADAESALPDGGDAGTQGRPGPDAGLPVDAGSGLHAQADGGWDGGTRGEDAATTTSSDGGPTQDASPSGWDAGVRADSGPQAPTDAGQDSLPDAQPLRDAAQGLLMEATVQCPPRAGACQFTAGVLTEPRATYRKDVYLDPAAYREVTPVPASGGRLHVAATSAVSGAWTRVLLNGQDLAEMQDSTGLVNWFHVWPRHLVSGGPMWVAFHTQDPAFDVAGATFDLVVESSAGIALSARIPVDVALVPVTGFSTSETLETAFVHLRNEDAQAHTVSRVLFNGVDVTSSSAACLASNTLAAGQVALVTVPLCVPLDPGDAWTVVVEFTSGPPSVAVGRVLPPLFPIEAWPVGADCPFPLGGAPQAAFEKHREAFMDTLYMYWSGTLENGCNFFGGNLVNGGTAALQGMRVLVGDDFLNFNNPEDLILDTSMVAGFLTGDESDGEVFLEDGSSAAAEKADDARSLWDMYPGVPVYNGAKTNRNVGAFAGMTDVQGMDFYAAACAPHITPWGTNPPLRAPYDYLRNTRNNHAPLPTWMYAQGLHGGWNRNSLAGERIFQPDPQEIEVQAMMVVAAGGKGLMWFQTSLTEATREPARWDAMARINKTVRSVRRMLLQGDLMGGVTTSSGPDRVLVDAIRAPEALVVPVINLLVQTAVTDTACAAAQGLGFPAPPHWVLDAQTLDVTVVIPPDVPVAEVLEVRDGVVQPVHAVVNRAARTVQIPGVTLDNTIPTRLFVVAGHAGVRLQVQADAVAP